MTGPILVAGAAGRLGASIVDAFAGSQVIAQTRATLDITDPETVRKVVGEAAPAVIINCVGFNDVDGAEDHPAEALAVNAFAVRSLARGRVLRRGARSFRHRLRVRRKCDRALR